MAKADEVVVVGGGVVGLNTAYFLARRGVRVTVLERDRVGSGASRGNAGEVCPDLVSPLPAPGLVGHAIGNLHRRDSALYIRPQLSLALTAFLWRFWRNSNLKARDRGTAYLSALAAPTRDLFREYQSLGLVPELNDSGFLYVHGSRESAQAHWDAVRDRLDPGRRDLLGAILGPDELKAEEPCLGGAAKAGFLVRDQWAVDPSAFVDKLADAVRAQGTEIIEGARVTGIDDGGEDVLVRSGAGNVRAGAAVIAAGAGSTAVCRRLGVSLPVFPGKGYSFFVPADRPPSRVVALEDAHVGVTPMAGRVRVAGTMEFDAAADRFNPARVAAIITAASPFLDGFHWEQRDLEWSAPRPMTPNGLPVIGPLAGHPSVFVAVGHNMLGLMLSPATGKAVADLVVDGKTWFDPTAP